MTTELTPLDFGLPLRELLQMWSELDDTYWGHGGWGGNVAEIYVYRFMRFSPIAVRHMFGAGSAGEIGRQEHAEVIRAANESMFMLFDAFKRQRGCRVFVEGRALGVWLRRADFAHRVKVRIEQGADREEESTDG